MFTFTSTDPPCATQEPSGTGMCACDRAISANVLVCGLYRVLMHVGKLGPASGRSPDGVRVFQSLCTLTHTKPHARTWNVIAKYTAKFRRLRRLPYACMQRSLQSRHKETLVCPVLQVLVTGAQRVADIAHGADAVVSHQL